MRVIKIAFSQCCDHASLRWQSDPTSLDEYDKANQFIHLYCGDPLMLCLLLLFLIVVLIIIRQIIQCAAADSTI